MNDNKQFDAFRDKINSGIRDRLNRPTLTESLQEQNEKQATRKNGWMAELKADRATYIIMAVSATFTAMLGLLMGLAPTLVTNADGSTNIFFHTDALHWVIAILYIAAFVSVTEVAFIVAKQKFHVREEGNITQQASMTAMMFMAGVSIVGTGWAGGTIAASVLGFLTDFKEIPHSAQRWVVAIIPVLLAVYAFLLTFYRLSSLEEKSKRMTDQMTRKQRLDHELQMAMVELEGDEQLQLAEIESYQRAVSKGLLSAAEAQAARRAGKTLRQLEGERGQDLNGDRKIDNTPIPELVERKNGQYHPNSR
jgi:MFS family permease